MDRYEVVHSELKSRQAKKKLKHFRSNYQTKRLYKAIPQLSLTVQQNHSIESVLLRCTVSANTHQTSC